MGIDIDDYSGVDKGSCGNSIDIRIPTKDTAEIRADIVVESSAADECCDVIRIWGQVVDNNNRPIPRALLKLVKVVKTPNGRKYQGIAHGVSDCQGFYQFDAYYCTGDEYYKIIVSKMYTGREEVLRPQKTGKCCGNERSRANDACEYNPKHDKSLAYESNSNYESSSSYESDSGYDSDLSYETDSSYDSDSRRDMDPGYDYSCAPTSVCPKCEYAYTSRMSNK